MISKIKQTIQKFESLLTFVAFCLAVLLWFNTNYILVDILLALLLTSMLLKELKNKNYFYLTLALIWIILMPAYGREYFSLKYLDAEIMHKKTVEDGGVILLFEGNEIVYVDEKNKCHSRFLISNFYCRKILNKHTNAHQNKR